MLNKGRMYMHVRICIYICTGQGTATERRRHCGNKQGRFLSIKLCTYMKSTSPYEEKSFSSRVLVLFTN